jgi:hypothetical protein
MRLESTVQGALRSTMAFGPWPAGAWTIHLHETSEAFEGATGAPPQRAAAWVGNTLHLRPWAQLGRRDLGAVLRHELTHRRLIQAGLRRWEEEARCLWAEDHVAPPRGWPAVPAAEVQTRLDRALTRGGTALQSWAYTALRAWLHGRPLPEAPASRKKPGPAWSKEALGLDHPVTVRWAEQRLPRHLEINGHGYAWRPFAPAQHFTGEVHFGNGPISRLSGSVDLRATPAGWQVLWHTQARAWIAAAAVGELREDAPVEARRALAGLLARWLENHPEGHHGDGSLCPLTHCAVVRGDASEETLKAADAAPQLKVRPRLCFFTGSTGGQRLSPREVWGEPSDSASPAEEVPGDRWARWTRSFRPDQVARLKRAVRPGLKAGQKGLKLGPSGPYAVESLRLAAGRLWGWTCWPSNAVTVALDEKGTLTVEGHGWGHNAGLDLALARHQAESGMKAEEILRRAFGADAVD